MRGASPTPPALGEQAGPPACPCPLPVEGGCLPPKALGFNQTHQISGPALPPPADLHPPAQLQDAPNQPKIPPGKLPAGLGVVDNE